MRLEVLLPSQNGLDSSPEAQIFNLIAPTGRLCDPAFALFDICRDLFGNKAVRRVIRSLARTRKGEVPLFSS
jgi:hypothetical protein